ncbi:MAG TPA: hypothetical protein DCQ31_18190 [Bacteroidales bacterium]|nr:hypothetical protein [Bacteroidales bacterium]
METLIITVDNSANALFLQELLQKFQFVKAIETENKHEKNLQERYKLLPVRWASAKPNITDFTCILVNRKLSITEIREKAWKRNW